MELRLYTQKASTAFFRLGQAFGATLLLAFAVSQVHASQPVVDYRFPVNVSGGTLQSVSGTESSGNSSKTTALVSYETFDGLRVNLQENRGRFVNVLLPGGVNEGLFFTSDHVTEMVDLLDELYVIYRDLIGGEPAGKGLLTIAFVPQTCSMGCALVGHKGIEILSDPINYELIIRELDAGRLETILVHELVHNFDLYARHLHYLPDHAHAWTDFFEFFAPYRYARNTHNGQAADDIFHSPGAAAWKSYITDETASWASCVRDQDCADGGLSANNAWAILYYRFEAVYGIEALLDSFAFLTDHVSRFVPPQTALEKEGLRILSLAVGAGANISCQLDALNWPLTATVENELRSRFGNHSPDCADADQDGFIAMTGDCDDTDPASNVLSDEIENNGKDDDCDGLIDETALVEFSMGSNPDNFVQPVLAQMPFEVAGSTADVSDQDIFVFPTTPTRRAHVTLCASDQFSGWAVALQPDGSMVESSNWYAYQRAAGCTSNTFDYGDLNNVAIAVMPDNTHGDYSLVVKEADALPVEHSTLFTVVPQAGGGVSFRVDDPQRRLALLGADQLEFWVSGAGLRISTAYSPAATVSLDKASAPELKSGSTYQARMRPLANGQPLLAFSAGQLFRYDDAPVSVPVVDSRYSGAWFDPRHDGEGFIVEVLENQRALVYWFTFTRDGRQRWFFGVGEVSGNRILIDEMMDTHGGRFGDNFNPQDIELSTVGSLSISFLSCSDALVNYVIDNTGGHQTLSRLTHLLGHRCGTAGTPPASDLSGSWYDPAHDGEGFVVEQISETEATVFWFTYDSQGNQSWLFNTGLIDGGRITFPELLQPAGGKFGRSFKPESVSRTAWGTLELQIDCNGGPASYHSNATGYSSGTQSLVNLTRLQNSGCNSNFR